MKTIGPILLALAATALVALAAGDRSGGGDGPQPVARRVHGTGEQVEIRSRIIPIISSNQAKPEYDVVIVGSGQRGPDRLSPDARRIEGRDANLFSVSACRCISDLKSKTLAPVDTRDPGPP